MNKTHGKTSSESLKIFNLLNTMLKYSTNLGLFPFIQFAILVMLYF